MKKTLDFGVLKIYNCKLYYNGILSAFPVFVNF